LLLKKFNLPTAYRIKDVDTFYEHFFLDKKSADNSIKFILPRGIGDHTIEKDIDEKIVKGILSEFGEEE
jgi:3-dehydroquinate synthase